MARILVTADDLGLSEEINAGLFEAHRNGIVRNAALLVNAPATHAAVSKAKDYPDLEIGLHLSIVEGFSLVGTPSTVTDSLRYLDGNLCLIRDWKTFLSQFLTLQIRLEDLRLELERQFQKFLEFYPTVPFINTTQHLHFFPGLNSLVVDLARRYGAKSIRSHGFAGVNQSWLHPRTPQSVILQILGAQTRKIIPPHIHAPDRIEGFLDSGQISEEILQKILVRASREDKLIEVVCHPGHESTQLRRDLPGAYSSFNWKGELQALTSPRIKALIASLGIQNLRFSELDQFRPFN